MTELLRAELPLALRDESTSAGHDPMSGTAADDLAVRRWRLAQFVLGAFALAVGILILDASPVGVAIDDAMYVILAKSLATGQGYRFLNLPGAPAGTHYPPGYPALLALLWRIAPDFPANLMLFKAVNALWLAVTAVAVARFARARLLPTPWALATGAVTAVSAPLLVLGALLMSEPFFLALLIPLLAWTERFVDEPAALGAAGIRRPVLLGIAIGAALLIRTHAIALLPAIALLLAMRRRWRDAAIVCGVAIVCLLPWQVWSARHAADIPAALRGEYGSYLGWWMRGFREMGPSMVPMTLRRTFAETGSMFAVLFSPLRGETAHLVTLISLAAVVAVGIAARWRRMPVTLLFTGIYLSIIALWPFPSSRFVWSIWPLILLVLFSGGHRIQLWVRDGRLAAPRRALAMAAAVAVVWIAAGYVAYETRAARGRWWLSIPRENTARIVPAVRWTLANTAPTDIIATDDEGAIFLYTGRRTVPVRSFTVRQYLTTIPVEADVREGLIPILAAYPVRTVVVGSVASLQQAEWLAAQPRPLVARREVFPEGAAFTVLGP